MPLFPEGDQSTRDRLLDAAERLFAEEGLGVVSLRRIAAEAGQRNTSAVGYHFGGHDILLTAILDRRYQVIEARRTELLRSVFDQNTPTLHQLVNAFVEPFAHTLNEPWGQYHVRFVAQARYWPGAKQLWRPGSGLWPVTPSITRTLEEIRARLAVLPDPVIDARLQQLRLQTVDSVVAWSHLPDLRGQRLTFAVHNLVDSFTAALQVLPSAETIRAMDEIADAPTGPATARRPGNRATTAQRAAPC
jgi:AcrR family transcriptional regulator